MGPTSTRNNCDDSHCCSGRLSLQGRRLFQRSAPKLIERNAMLIFPMARFAIARRPWAVRSILPIVDLPNLLLPQACRLLGGGRWFCVGRTGCRSRRRCGRLGCFGRCVLGQHADCWQHNEHDRRSSRREAKKSLHAKLPNVVITSIYHDTAVSEANTDFQSRSGLPLISALRFCCRRCK